jgi:hypothetical protein
MTPYHICSLYENLLECYENLLNISTRINDDPAQTVDIIIQIRVITSDMARLVRYLVSQSYHCRFKGLEMMKQKYLRGEGKYFGYDKDIEVILELMHQF